MKRKRIHIVVVTGGPCGGKTESIPFMFKRFTEKGYKVFVIPETATLTLNSGITPNIENRLILQGTIMALQTTFEEHLKEAAVDHVKRHDQDVIIISDRGLVDCLIYTPTKKDFVKLLSENGVFYGENPFEFYIQRLYERYDGVVHVQSVAVGTDLYQKLKENNPARYDDESEAIERDQKNIDVWKDHPNFRLVDNSTGWDEKLQRLEKAIDGIIKS